MKTLFLLTSLLFVIVGFSFAQLPSDEVKRYPNELPGYKFYEKAKWKSLEPLISTMADVRRVLGEPAEAHDVSQYTKPYPGDAAAKQPVLTYNLDDDWRVLVYFTRYCFYDGPPLPTSLDDRLCTIDLIPKKPISFGAVAFPPIFKKKNVTAIDAGWDQYTDGSGLVYEVYTTKAPSGSKQAGDLNRIKYGPSDAAIRKYGSQ